MIFFCRGWYVAAVAVELVAGVLEDHIWWTAVASGVWWTAVAPWAPGLQWLQGPGLEWLQKPGLQWFKKPRLQLACRFFSR